MTDRPRAVLVLADGTVFEGNSIGIEGSITGEVVFNTAMSGHQEILTDPAYHRQLVTLTYPHVGNGGFNPEDTESVSDAPHIHHAAGLIIRNFSPVVEAWRQYPSLSAFLKQHHIPAIAGVDTRKLVRILREKGTQSACLMAGHIDKNEALHQAKIYAGIAGVDLTQEASCRKSWQFDQPTSTASSSYQIAVLDLGVKRTVLHQLANRNCRITIYPVHTSAEAMLSTKPDGIVISGGPGDPSACEQAITTVRSLLVDPVPLFGMGLGHQIIALALGARTTRLKSGHHGVNHPVRDIDRKRAMITSQNHDFVVLAETLPANTRITHLSLFDGSLQGFMLTDQPVIAFQGNPEAGPGPHDMHYLFDLFIDQIKNKK